MSDRTAIRIGGQGSSDRALAACHHGRRRRARRIAWIGAGHAARAGHDHQHVTLRGPARRDRFATSSVPPPSASMAALRGGQLAVEVAALPGDEDAARTRSGNASSTSSASGATARAVTAGQRPRWRGSAASVSARAGGRRDPVAEAGRLDGGREEAGLLADRIDEQRPRAGSAAASGRPGKPPPEPRSRNAVDAAGRAGARPR